MNNSWYPQEIEGRMRWRVRLVCWTLAILLSWALVYAVGLMAVKALRVLGAL